MTPLMSKANQRSLEQNDIWTVSPSRRTELMDEKFMRNLAILRKPDVTYRALLYALFASFRPQFLVGGVCQLISAIIQVVNPFILRYLISFLAGAHENNASHVAHGIGLVILMTALQFVQSGCANQFLHQSMLAGSQSRAVLISAISQKAMRSRPEAQRTTVPTKVPETQQHLAEQSPHQKSQIGPDPHVGDSHDRSPEAVDWNNSQVLVCRPLDISRGRSYLRNDRASYRQIVIGSIKLVPCSI